MNVAWLIDKIAGPVIRFNISHSLGIARFWWIAVWIGIAVTLAYAALAITWWALSIWWQCFRGCFACCCRCQRVRNRESEAFFAQHELFFQAAFMSLSVLFFYFFGLGQTLLWLVGAKQ